MRRVSEPAEETERIAAREDERAGQPELAHAQIPAPRTDPELMETAAHYAAAIYGSILTTSLVAALEYEHANASTLLWSVAATVLVFWLAHVWSAFIAERVVHARRFDWHILWRNAAQEWPIVEAAVPPLIGLALAAIGVYGAGTGAKVALWVGIAHLVGWGMFVGRRTHRTWFAAIVTGMIDGAFGVAIVLLEVALH